VTRKAEEKKEERAKVQNLKIRLQDEVEMLDKLYRERLSMLDDQTESVRHFSK
jgi:hypothetical protein